jgi:polysaccharide biosynthesis/export protein
VPSRFTSPAVWSTQSGWAIADNLPGKASQERVAHQTHLVFFTRHTPCAGQRVRIFHICACIGLAFRFGSQQRVGENLRGRFPSLLLLAALTGCTQLPVDGPSYRDIDSGATAALVGDRRAVVFDYVLIDINQAVLDWVPDVGPGSFFQTFGAGRGPAPEIRFGVGDVVQVSIFESSSGGLFIPPEASVRPGNFVTLPNQTISRSGTITIPYADQIRAAGRTAREIEQDIVSKLANRAIQPQVVVTWVEQSAMAVAVLGDPLLSANKFQIRPSGERVMDMISRAGGIRFPGYELFVTLQRKNRRATVYFPTLVNKPQENIYVRPGDTIYVHREPQKFVAVGALSANGQTSGVTAQFAFEQERLSLNEAIAKAGGLMDARANPGQVFLYRAEYREALERMGLDLSKFPPETKFIPTIYRANFRDPSVFFFAQNLAMRHKDVIYVANADAVEVVKFLAYVRAISSTVSGVATDAVTTQDALRGRHVLGQ